MTDRPAILQLHRGEIHPPSNGEEVRIWETAKKFAEYGSVWLAHPDGDGSDLHPGVKGVGTDNPFLNYKTTRIYAWNATFGLAADNGLDRLQAGRTVRTLDRLDAEFDVVCCESPQMLRAGRRLAARYDAKLLLNKHNAMYDLLDQQLGLRPVPSSLRQRAVKNLRRFEQWGIDAADAVVFQSEDDATRFRLPDDAVVEVIPNGTDFDHIDSGGDPGAVREEFGLDGSETVCLYVGAFDYDPNEVAAEVIADELAPALPDIEFLLVGRNPPSVDRENVHTPGFVDDLPGTLSLADIAICPLTLGSGTKLKMLDYLAAGLPIVTTEVGAQGLPLEDGETALIRDSWNGFVEAIERLEASESLRDTLSSNAQVLGREYSWDSLLERYDPVIAELLSTSEVEADTSTPNEDTRASLE
ncbi:glycosyltransferase family 4 protein (plasmid) [Halorussus salilacus]|uniref:glycosyltransferase family 4 protein n=1 Tax=Halorussus salilacus TaxID=2953750 RepID=UPI00209D2EAF|nr:glycosyltransferase family 4 protein [Halorussus salilacus]USZ69749.1 glycosyltransferase family 4 protein [Halorussus salilacus]